MHKPRKLGLYLETSDFLFSCVTQNRLVCVYCSMYYIYPSCSFNFLFIQTLSFSSCPKTLETGLFHLIENISFPQSSINSLVETKVANSSLDTQIQGLQSESLVIDTLFDGILYTIQLLK